MHKIKRPYILITLGAFFIYIFITALSLYFTREDQLPADSGQYLLMASGETNLVPSPFTYRFLNSFFAQQINRIFGLNLNISFAIISGFSISLFIIILYIMNYRNNLKIFLLYVVFTPSFLLLLQEAYLSDALFYLLQVLFLLAIKKKYFNAIPILSILLSLTRELAIIMNLAFLTIALKARDLFKTLHASALIISGLAITYWAGSNGSINASGFSGPLYILLKYPANFLRNIFGVWLWTDVSSSKQPESYWHPPLVSINLPSFSSNLVGSVTKIGIYELNIRFPLHYSILFAALFGFLPTIFIFYWKNKIHFFSQLSDFLQIAFLTGIAMLVLSPGSGFSIARYVMACWPLFWIIATLDRNLLLSHRWLPWINAVVMWLSWYLLEISEFGSNIYILLTFWLFLVVVNILFYSSLKSKIKGNPGAL
jgi:hypothetical protein